MRLSKISLSTFIRHSPRVALILLSALGFVVSFAGSALAQDFPTKPLRLIIPFGAGGVADTTSRLMAAKMSEKLGQPINVENISVGGAAVAIKNAKDAPADGHTMVMVTNSSAIAVSLVKTQSYDIPNDLAAVSLVGSFEFFFVTKPDAPYKSLQDFLTASKASGGKLTIMPNTPGSTQHLAILMLRRAIGPDFAVTPSANSNELIDKVAKGEMEVGVDGYAVLKPALVSGKLRAIASTGTKPLPLLPNIGTVRDLTGKDEFDVRGWNSIYVKAGTPPAMIDKINAAVRTALEDDGVKRALLDVGIAAEATTPAAMTALYKDSVDKWAAVIAANDIEKIEK